jgi:dolichol-phosphate mannosyltransferase
MKLSIVMPVYNEKRTIREILDLVAAAPTGGLEKEIVVVDDCSKDGTREILDGIQHIPNLRVFKHDVNGGKGAAIATAFRNVTGDVVIIQDADMEYDPNDYPRLVAPIVSGQTKVVYGARNLESQKWFMAMGNRGLTLITNILYGLRIKDMETCYKTLHRDVIQGLNLECRRFDVEAELTAKIARRGFKIIEVPIKYVARYEEKKLSPLDGWPAVRALLKYRFVAI